MALVADEASSALDDEALAERLANGPAGRGVAD